MMKPSFGANEMGSTELPKLKNGVEKIGFESLVCKQSLTCNYFYWRHPLSGLARTNPGSASDGKT